MNAILVILIILIIVTAILFVYSLYNQKNPVTDLQKCTSDIIKLVGGSEKIVSLHILNKIMPYLKEIDNSKPLEDYLLKHFEYRASERDKLRKLASKDDLAPNKYKLLHTIISDIINNNNIYSVEEFIKRSRLTYREFLPNEYKRIFDDYVKLAIPVKEDIKKMSKILDKYLSAEGTYLIKSKLLDKTEDLINKNSEYKFKSGKLDLTPTKLKTMIDSDPKKVFEIDYIGMIPAIQEAATLSSTKNKYNTIENELRNQLEQDIETLQLLRNYPLTLARQRERDEIVRRLEIAASRLYSPMYARNLLKDLYSEYPYLTPFNSLKTDKYDYIKRIEAERETVDERNKRIAAEQQRDVARAAQINADRVIAESLQKDDEKRQKEIIEEEQRLAQRNIELEKIKELEQLNKEQMHKLDAIESQDVKEVLENGDVPDDLKEIWKMGSHDLKESKDNRNVPMIPLNF